MNAVNEIVFTVTDHLHEAISDKASDDVLALVNCQNELLIALLVEDRELLNHRFGFKAFCRNYYLTSEKFGCII